MSNNSREKTRRRFTRFAWFVVVFNLLVIAWGAFVRASKSGDGCGESYPLCNGMIVPHAAEIKTIVEFSHRLSSGIALLLVIALLIWAFRLFPRKHQVRKVASLSFVFILIEAAIGAILVLFRLVAHDESLERAIFMPAHLVSHFILIAALALTAWFAANERKLMLKANQTLSFLFAVALVGLTFVGMTGALAALGDTLFPSSSLAHGIEQDFSASAHFLIRLRIWHPILSILFGGYAALLAAWLMWKKTDEQSRKFAYGVIGLVAVQLIVGAVNVLLLAPIWMQLIHLALADLLWLSVVLLSASTLTQTAETTVVTQKPQTSLKTAAQV